MLYFSLPFAGIYKLPSPLACNDLLLPLYFYNVLVVKHVLFIKKAIKFMFLTAQFRILE